MGFRLPAALAGDDPEVTYDTDGLMKIGQLTGGVALAGLIVGAGLWIKNKAEETSGQDLPSITVG